MIANLPGLEGTFWRSDVNILNVSDTDTSVVLMVLPELVGGIAAFETEISDPINITAHTQLNISNVLQSRFGLVNVKGSLFIYSLEGTPLAISSRTYTVGQGGGTYGQEVSGLQVEGTGWATGLRHDDSYRTTVGVLWPWEDPVQFEIAVFTSDGQEVASHTFVFTRSGLQQIGLGDMGVSSLLSGYLEITCSDARALWYGYSSRVDQISGDGVFRLVRSAMPELF